MLGKPVDNLLGADELQGFAESPSVAVHEEGNEHDETPIGPIEGVNQAAHGILFARLNKFIEFLELLEGLVP